MGHKIATFFRRFSAPAAPGPAASAEMVEPMHDGEDPAPALLEMLAVINEPASSASVGNARA